MVKSDFDVDRAAKAIARTDEQSIIEKVKNKIEEYLNNVRNSLDSFEKEGTGSPIFKGLPKKYYVYLEQVIEFMKD